MRSPLPSISRPTTLLVVACTLLIFVTSGFADDKPTGPKVPVKGLVVNAKGEPVEGAIVLITERIPPGRGMQEPGKGKGRRLSDDGTHSEAPDMLIAPGKDPLLGRTPRGKPVARAKTDADGTFEVQLAPGKYRYQTGTRSTGLSAKAFEIKPNSKKFELKITLSAPS